MKKIKYLFLIFCLFITAGCKLHADDFCSYKIAGEIVADNSSNEYKIGGLKCNMCNLFSKKIEKFIVVFSLYDEEGNPFMTPKYEVTGELDVKEYAEFILNLDEYLEDVNPSKISVDFIYVSKITFEDGSEWTDPYGLKYFMK